MKQAISAIAKSLITYPERRALSRFVYGKSKRTCIYKPFVLDKDYIFIHIPKAAGKSVALAVYGDDKPGHYSVKDYLYYDQKHFEESFIFAFVRHPIDRFLSAYSFLKQGGTSHGDQCFSESVMSKYVDVNHFIEDWVDSRNINKKEHFVPQAYYLKDNKGKVRADFIGKFESIEQDFFNLMNKLRLDTQLSHSNRTKQKTELQVDESNIEKLKRVYREDFELFGYE
ncbi:sulfotransferase family 2 domain-containing protein [Catenovulum sp. SX2]|uniref:sulfotransferase family 2 domain-containing protein n=1 Tax=Catenovulum sp. SX2 TaxID=3398614 RepID=UPI003F845612